MLDIVNNIIICNEVLVLVHMQLVIMYFFRFEKLLVPKASTNLSGVNYKYFLPEEKVRV